MYPPAASTASRSPDRKPISPSVTIEYSSSRVWRWGGTRAPTGNGCSTTETWPLVSRPQNLKATPIMPKSPVAPSPGCKMVSGGGSTVTMKRPCLSRKCYPPLRLFFATWVSTKRFGPVVFHPSHPRPCSRHERNGPAGGMNLFRCESHPCSNCMRLTYCTNSAAVNWCRRPASSMAKP
jgi:hypothetical protein